MISVEFYVDNPDYAPGSDEARRRSRRRPSGGGDPESRIPGPLLCGSSPARSPDSSLRSFRITYSAPRATCKPCKP